MSAEDIFFVWWKLFFTTTNNNNQQQQHIYNTHIWLHISRMGPKTGNPRKQNAVSPSLEKEKSTKLAWGAEQWKWFFDSSHVVFKMLRVSVVPIWTFQALAMALLDQGQNLTRLCLKDLHLNADVLVCRTALELQCRNGYRWLVSAYGCATLPCFWIGVIDCLMRCFTF